MSDTKKSTGDAPVSESSEEFFLAFSAGHGSYCITCACGRTYFASEVNGWAEPGEIEVLRKKAIADPTMFIDTWDAGVSMVNLGDEYVHGCACGTERRYEDWIWRHRRAIAQYLKANTVLRLKTAQQDAAEVETL